METKTKSNKKYTFLIWTLVGIFVMIGGLSAVNYMNTNSQQVSNTLINDSEMCYMVNGVCMPVSSGTADVVVCRGTSVADDIYKSVKWVSGCDVVCKSTDGDCGDDINTARLLLVSSFNGGIVYISGGNYSVKTTITSANSGVVFKGENLGGTSQTVSGTNTVLINAASDIPVGSNLFNITGSRNGVLNMWIKGNSNTNDCLFTNGYGVNLENVQVSNCGNDGIKAGSSSSQGIINNVYSFNNSNNGVEILYNDWRITKLFSFDNVNGAGLFLNTGSGTLVSTSHIWGNNYNLELNGTDKLSFSTSVLESSYQNNLYIDGSSIDTSQNSFIGNQFYNNNQLSTSLTNSHILFNSAGTNIYEYNFIGNNFDDSGIMFNYTGTNTMRDINVIGNSVPSVGYGNVPNSVFKMDSVSNVSWNYIPSLVPKNLLIASGSVVTASVTAGNLNIYSTDVQGIDKGGSMTLGGYSDDAGTTLREFASIEGRKESGTTTQSSGYLLFKVNNAGSLNEMMRINSTGEIIIPSSHKICFDGATCSAYIKYNGSCLYSGKSGNCI